MSFTEKIEVQINSVFDSKGFKRLQKNIASVNQNFQAMGQFFRQAKGMSNMVQEAERFESVLERANLQFKELGSDKQIQGFVGGSGVFGGEDIEKIKELGGVFEQANGEAIRMGEAMRRVGGIISESASPEVAKEAFQNIDGDPIPATMDNRDDTSGLPPREQRIQIQTVDNLERSRLGQLKNRLIKLRNNDKVNRSINGVKNTTSKLTGGLRKGAIATRAFSGALRSSMGSALSNVAPSVQNLQMKLLGLQFTMLTVAFLFGGLATGALGAVGVFETLSNTFKFLFLPTALNVLDGVLKLQEAVFSLSEPFREALGNASLTVAAFASVISIGAILSQAILSLIGPLISLAGVLGAPLTLLLAVAGALGLIAFRGSLAAQEGSKLNSFLETAGNLASKLFKFTGSAASKLGQFLGQMFSNIGQFFMNADWGDVWSNFFDFAANARNKAGNFMKDTASRLKEQSKKVNWNKVWDQFFDFTGEAMSEANEFLTETINRFANWAANEADWKQIWNAYFDFQENAAKALGRFLGQVLGEIVTFFMNIDFGKLFKASLSGSKGRQEALKEQKSLIQEANIGASFTQGFQQGLNDVRFNDGPDVNPANTPSVQRTQNQFQIDMNTTINGKNNTTREDVNTMQREFVGLFSETGSSATARGGNQ